MEVFEGRWASFGLCCICLLLSHPYYTSVHLYCLANRYIGNNLLLCFTWQVRLFQILACNLQTNGRSSISTIYPLRNYYSITETQITTQLIINHIRLCKAPERKTRSSNVQLHAFYFNTAKQYGNTFREEKHVSTAPLTSDREFQNDKDVK
jgi:hypothetical protein